MKIRLLFALTAVVLTSCTGKVSVKELENEILAAEKSFEKMAADSGIAAAFEYFAAPEAILKRENDTLIRGKSAIGNFYRSQNLQDVTVNWSPDFVRVSESGDMGYTYGRYVWRIRHSADSITELRGIFHTVWEKQEKGEWRYVWD